MLVSKQNDKVSEPLVLLMGRRSTVAGRGVDLGDWP